MLLYEARDYSDQEFFQERGDVGTFDVGEAMLDTFLYEDLSVSRYRNLSRELMKEVHKARRSAPEVFADHYQGYALSLEAQSAANLVHPNMATPEEYEAIIEPNFEALRERIPDLRDRDQIDASIAEQAKAKRDEFDKLYVYADPYAAFFGSLGGAMVGAMADPINIMTLPIGAGRVAGAGFLKGMGIVMARSFGIGVASEAAIQPFVYDYKKEINSPYDLSDAVFNMAAAGIGNSLLSGVGHAIGRGWDGMVARGEIPPDHASRPLMDQIKALQAITDESGAKTQPELEAHLGALNKALADLQAGKPIDFDALGTEIDEGILKGLDGEVADLEDTLDALRKVLDRKVVDDDLLAQQLELERTASQKLTRAEKKAAQQLPEGEEATLDPDTDLDKIQDIQKAHWEKAEAESRLQAQDEAKAAEKALKESRKQGDMVRVKAEREELEAQIAAHEKALEAAQKAREAHIQERRDRARGLLNPLTNPEVAKTFLSELRSYAGGRRTSKHPFNLGNPGPLLLSFGVPDLPVRLKQQVISKARKKHKIDPLTFESLPEQIQRPVAIFASKKGGDIRVLLTELESPDGKKIVAVLEVKTDEKGLLVNNVDSLHDKDGFKLDYWVEDKLLLGVDKDRGRFLIGAVPGSHSPADNQELASGVRLYSTGAEVKVSGVKPAAKAPVSDDADLDAEASRLMDDEMDDGVVFDEQGNEVSFKESVARHDQEVAALDAIKVCML